MEKRMQMAYPLQYRVREPSGACVEPLVKHQEDLQTWLPATLSKTRSLPLPNPSHH
uniref:Uncharacterized protein n=1 Tax=Ralstonia solanacearum TaxID=305 RepID=A0A0S4WG97_RALSL|nr:protein of unknown function [Ralstonia solanacearum]